VLNTIRIVFKETGMPEKGEKIIKDTTEDIMRLNNEGVDLARRGKLAEAIDYFEKAAARLPENKIINANAAQVLMLFMKQNGPDEERLSKASSYLERVRRIDGAYADIPMLLSMYRELASREVSS